MAGVHQSPDGVMTPTGQLKPNSHHETIPVGKCVDAREFKRVKTAADMRADRSSTHIRTCSRMRMGGKYGHTAVVPEGVDLKIILDSQDTYGTWFQTQYCNGHDRRDNRSRQCRSRKMESHFV